VVRCENLSNGVKLSWVSSPALKQAFRVKLLSKNNVMKPLDRTLAGATLTRLQEGDALLGSVILTTGVIVRVEPLVQLVKVTGISNCDLFIKPWAVSLIPDKVLSVTFD
jgi:hypothetical protein